MKRYKETQLSEFVSKISDSKTTSNRPTLDTSAVTAETAVVANEGSFCNATDLIVVGGVVNYSVVNDANNPNDFGLAVGANLSDVDKLRFLTDFYAPPESYTWPTATRIDPAAVCKHWRLAAEPFTLIFTFCFKYLQVYQFRLLHLRERSRQ